MIPREIHAIMRHGFTMEFHVYRRISTDGQFHGNPCDYAAMENHGIPWKWKPWKFLGGIITWIFHGIPWRHNHMEFHGIPWRHNHMDFHGIVHPWIFYGTHGIPW